MFIEELESTYGIGTPIFADEILKLFSNYSKAYIFRLIKAAENEGSLVCYSRGIYYIPRKTFFGQSAINPEMIAEKKYLRDNQSVYGIYSGVGLLNRFGITTQMPNTIEIVTNNETTRRRKITIGERNIILRKSRCEITSKNYTAYTLLQLFNDMDKSDTLDSFSKKQIKKFMRDNGILGSDLLSMSKNFPASALKKMIESEVLDGTL